MIKSQNVEILKPHVEFIPVCPEVEIGLGVPRKPIRIVHEKDGLHLMQSETKRDLTDKMTQFAENFLNSLDEVDGFILKDRSPSCGNKDVKIYPRLGKVAPIDGKGTGFFGAAVQETFSHLAVENEGRLNNFRIREHFYTKLFAIASLREMKKKGMMKELVRFHSENKYLMMAYNQTRMRELGRIVANPEKKPVDDLLTEYENLFYDIFKKMPRYTSNINVLQHCLGYFSDELSSEEKQFFLNTLGEYRQNKVPLSVCIALMRSWIIRFDEDYLKHQTFFYPYPKGLVEITDSGKGRG
jgi:uncharacterized protein YbgA (DUF1722 family)/uncharacterized protein YbbK (DUF523 family)